MQPNEIIPHKFVLLSYLEGMFYALMVASSESFALFISIKNGLSPFQIATVSTLPLLAGACTQWLVPKWINDHNVRPAILVSMFIQLLGIGGLFAFAKYNQNFYLLLSSISLYWMGGLVASPLWLDWATKHIPYVLFRGFISTRSGFVSFCTLLFYLATAYSFNHFTSLDISLIFVIGFIARLVSLIIQYFVSYVMKSPILEHKAEQTTFISVQGSDPEASRQAIIKILPVFIVWTGFFKFAVYVSSPFFLPYMINSLNFSIWDYSLVTGTALFGRSIFMTFWGKVTFGVMPFFALQLTGIFISLIPFLWVLSTNFTYLSFLEFGSGIFWGGFELSCILIIQNFISESPRRYLGLHMAIMNLFAVIGSYVGGTIIKSGYNYSTLFICSSVFRLSVVLIFIIILSRWPFVRLSIYSFSGYLTTALSFKPSQTWRILFPRRNKLDKN